MMRKKIFFILAALFCLCPFVDSAVALFAGIIFSLIFGNPLHSHMGTWSKSGLKISVVGLGFGMSITAVLSEGRRSIVITLIAIALTILVGTLIGKMLKVDKNISSLIAFGTAICGGSAIAAMAPVIEARDEETAVSLATVFSLNSAGLLIFPFVGRSLGLSQEAFGYWAALAIHDTSSVVGAAASYGTVALALATTVKLTRALWITPVVMVTSFIKKKSGKIVFPLFILGFILAAVIRSLIPQWEPLWSHLASGARRFLVMILFLIGSGLTWQVLKKVGPRPLLQGLALWILVSLSTLAVIYFYIKI
jgi:uncharacterized integral membrane protein (TIGR00698 family)